MKILIDAGHGGKDLGGGTNDLWKEKDKNLEISLYQFERFKELGFEVELTRTKDIFIDSIDRTNIVNNSGADICISNHINNVTNERANGAETIKSIYDKTNLAELILNEIAIKGIVKRRVVTRTLPKDRTKDYYYMNRMTNIPTIIIEYGFASNKEDTEIIKHHWKDQAEGVIKAILNYTNKFNYDDRLTRIENKLDKILNVFNLYQKANKLIN